MSPDQFFPLVALLCVAFWLLAREPRIAPPIRAGLQLAAYLGLGAALVYALFLTFTRFAG